MIVCVRTVLAPPVHRDAYLEWIADGREVREAHGILAELVLEPVDGETVVLSGRRRGVRGMDRHPRT